MAPPTDILTLPPYTTASTSRLLSLYSDISRQKRSNPTAYHSTVDWWRRVLQTLVSSGMQQDGGEPPRLVLNAGRGLMDKLKVDGVGKPLGLGTVITELCDTHPKSLIPLSQFLKNTQSIYDPGWLPGRIAAYVVGKPLWWALEQLGIVSEEGSSSSTGNEWWGDYVFVQLVEDAADRILEAQDRSGDVLYSFEGFKKTFGLGNDVDAKVVVKLLERDRRVLVVDKDVIKFVAENAPPEARQITPVDRGILELKTAVQNMHAQVEGIQRRIDESTRKATVALKQNHKPIALNHLRSRKLLEDLLQKRLGSLGVLEGTLMSVEAAAGDVEIMKSYTLSTTTLRTILSHPSLQRDKIDETMDALREANAEARDIGDTIRDESNVNLEVGDDDELEEELRGLVAEVQQEEETKNIEKLAQAGMKVPSERLPVADLQEDSSRRATSSTPVALV